MHRTLPTLPGQHCHLLRLERREGFVAHAFLQRCFDRRENTTVRRVERRAGLFHRDAGLETPKQIGPVRSAVLEGGRALLEDLAHGDRHEDRRPTAERGAAKSAWRDADDRHGAPINYQRLANRTVLTTESFLPELVTEYRDIVRTDHGIVGRAQQSSGGRLQAEYRKIRSRDEHSAREARLVVDRQAGAEWKVRRDAGEHRLLTFEILEHRIAEHFIAIARLTAILRTRFRARCPEIHEAIGRRHRQRLQQDFIEQREDGGVRTDAERQRRDRNGRHEGRLQQHANGKPDMSHTAARAGLVMGDGWRSA